MREEKVKVLTPREAGYAIQLSNKTLLDVRPSTERKKVDIFYFNVLILLDIIFTFKIQIFWELSLSLLGFGSLLISSM